MPTLSRALRRWEMQSVASAAIAAAFGLLLAAFILAAITVAPDASSVLAAVAAVAIAGAGILYAWPEPGR